MNILGHILVAAILGCLMSCTPRGGDVRDGMRKASDSPQQKVPYFFRVTLPKALELPSPSSSTLKWKSEILKEHSNIEDSRLFYPVDTELEAGGVAVQNAVYRCYSNPDLYFVWHSPVGFSWVIIDLGKKDIWVDGFMVFNEDKTGIILLVNKWPNITFEGETVHTASVFDESIAEYDQNESPYEFTGRTVRWTWGDIESYKEEANKEGLEGRHSPPNQP